MGCLVLPAAVGIVSEPSILPSGQSHAHRPVYGLLDSMVYRAVRMRPVMAS